ncbi:MAG: 2-ketoglutarate ferredoxin oxidoreductase subunit beta, partial [Halobacteriales archaeon]
PTQAKEILVEAIEHDGFAHVDFLTQCPTWNKDAQQYVPYKDVNENDEFEFDETDRREAHEMMHQTEQRLYEGEVLTGVYYRDEERPSYQEEKQSIGEMPDEPAADAYWEDDREWERSYDLLDQHK